MKALYSSENFSHNIVESHSLRQVQLRVLKGLAEAVMNSMGPYGANTLILKGSDYQSLVTHYTKDGKKIIKNILCEHPIEQSIQSEVEDIATYIEKKVGDGTSSATYLSYLIFKAIVEEFEKDGKRISRKEVQDLQSCIEEIQKEIKRRVREFRVEDAYNISMVSSNGNKEISDMIAKVYETHGKDVFIDVGVSMDENTYEKIYDGLTLDVGYDDPAYINTREGICRIDNPRIYSFEDPIDTRYTASLFEKILVNNILDPLNALSQGRTDKPVIPTVILVPKISRDQYSLLKEIIDYLYKFKESNIVNKPPIVVISGMTGMTDTYRKHIARLSGCTSIKKYIDDATEAEHQERGLAPTLENVHEFYGTAARFECDVRNCKFFHPSLMYQYDEKGSVIEDENGEPVFGDEYISIINFLNAEIEAFTKDGNNIQQVGNLKRQLNMLRANMVEIFVGGITYTDRDTLKDLVDDAVLNCRSAAKDGVGYGANLEGYLAAEYMADQRDNKWYKIIKDAYKELLKVLYVDISGMTIDDVEEMTTREIPMNIMTGEIDEGVLTSIMSDVEILEAIKKIITNMATSNQALIQAPQLNRY